MPGCRLKPKMPLGALVHCLWYWEGVPGPHLQERLLPNGEAAMIFDLREGPIALYDDEGRARHYGRAVFSGARSNCFTIDCNQQERVVGIQFRAGGASPFFRMPISAMEDASFDMADLWGGAADLVRDRLLEQPTPLAMLHTLERCLQERLRVAGFEPDRLHPAVVYMVGALDVCDGPARVRAVTEGIGMSQRRLTQIFHEQVGLSPKSFHCVRRFQHTLERLRGVRAVDWAAIALDCGYYDQAHLSHDFRRIAGMTPSAYLAAATEHLNHVPLMD